MTEVLRPATTGTVPYLDWFLTARLQLQDDVETLTGLDERQLMYRPATRKYVNATRGAARVAATFDGTRNGHEILAALGVDIHADTAARLARMAHDLRQAGFLTDEPAMEDFRGRATRFARKEHMFRFPLLRDVTPLLEPAAGFLRQYAARTLVILWAALALAGISIGTLAMFTVRVDSMPEHVWLLLPLLFAQIAIHESAHAIVCQYLKVPVREAGIALMLYFLPVGYVDRTDAYRVRSRSGRIMIALAGPLSDQIWFGVVGIIALTGPPQIAAYAVAMMVFQILLTVMNFNPFTPSDGYHAASAALGLINLRGNAFALIVHWILRADLPAHLAQSTRREKIIMVSYGIVCLLFALLLAAFTARTILTLLGAPS